MEIKEGEGRFCRRKINLKSTPVKYGNQGGQPLILSEENQPQIYSSKIWKSRRAATDFVGGI